MATWAIRASTKQIMAFDQQSEKHKFKKNQNPTATLMPTKIVTKKKKPQHKNT